VRLPKVFLVTGYLFLLSWWLIINLYGLRDSLGNLYFSLGIAFYSLLLGLYIFHTVFGSYPVEKLRKSVLVLCLGVISFGVSNLIWIYLSFIYTAVLFPSFADIFHLIQFSFFIVGLLFVSEFRLRAVIGKGLFALTLISILALLPVQIIGTNYFDVKTYFLFYLSLISLFSFILSLFMTMRNSRQGGRTPFLIIISLGFLSLFVGDIFFIYEVLTVTHFSAGFPDLLYLTGISMILFGIIIWGESKGTSLFFSEDGLTLFRKITYKVPTSLNVHM
jgi:hypothetical protein